MKKIHRIDNIAAYNSLKNCETLHPLISVIDLSKTTQVKAFEADALSFGFYAVFLKQGKHCDIRYGRDYYDYQDGTMVFIAPDQVIGIIKEDGDFKPSGHALLFHPDFIRGTSLGSKIREYTFFSYDVREALHMSERERQMIIECLNKIDFELQHAIDKHSKKIITSNIELLLDYCMRFYDRQFITRDFVNKGILERFESLLHEYFQSDKPNKIGTPSVGYCAGQLNLSANYFGDLIRKETGQSALDYIQSKLIEIAKEKVFNLNKSVSEIAYELGFKYPQHFTRFFKKHTGQTPNEYRLMN